MLNRRCGHGFFSRSRRRGSCRLLLAGGGRPARALGARNGMRMSKRFTRHLDDRRRSNGRRNSHSRHGYCGRHGAAVRNRKRDHRFIGFGNGEFAQCCVFFGVDILSGRRLGAILDIGFYPDGAACRNSRSSRHGNNLADHGRRSYSRARAYRRAGSARRDRSGQSDCGNARSLSLGGNNRACDGLDGGGGGAFARLVSKQSGNSRHNGNAVKPLALRAALILAFESSPAVMQAALDRALGYAEQRRYLSNAVFLIIE